MENSIFDIVKASKKYSSISDDTIHRICAEESSKYKKESDKIKAVKNKLHQISESYFSGSFSRLFKRLERGEDIDFFELLKYHSSTNERLSFYEEFYDDIFNTIGNINSILDIACGLNPILLAQYLFDNKININEYIANDINHIALDAIRYYSERNLPSIIVDSTDIILNVPDVKVDLVLLLKLIPLLEQQKKDYYKTLINELKAKYIAVSFPTKTMSGKNVGMSDNYKKMFDDFLSAGDFKTLFTKNYNNELLYIISR
jgi:16S rRNA (guanine(1405)-N(7))-methyltransferase